MQALSVSQKYWIVKAGSFLGILVLLEQDLVLIILCHLTKSLRLSMSYTGLHHRQFYWCQLMYHLLSLTLMISNSACYMCLLQM